MYSTRNILLKRMLPDGKCGGYIIFGNKFDFKSEPTVTINDPYFDAQASTEGREDVILFGESDTDREPKIKESKIKDKQPSDSKIKDKQPSDSKIKDKQPSGPKIKQPSESKSTDPAIQFYNPSESLNNYSGMKLWMTYSVRDMKNIVSAFIGCPVSHIDMRTSAESKSIGHIYDAEKGVAVIDVLRKVMHIPSEIELYIWGDHRDSNVIRERWPELYSEDSSKLGVAPLSDQFRAQILQEYLKRNVVYTKLSVLDTPKNIVGRSVSTGFSSQPNPSYFGLDVRRIFEMFHIGPLRSGVSISGIYYRGSGDKSIVAKIDERSVKPVKVAIPRYANSMTVQITLDKNFLPDRLAYMAPRSFIVSVREDSYIEGNANWGDIRKLDTGDAKIITRLAMEQVLTVIKKHHSYDYTLTENNISLDLTTMFPSNVQYYETFKGGNYAEFQDLTGRMTRNGMIKQIFTGETKTSFHVSAFDAFNRYIVLMSYIKEKIIGNNLAIIWQRTEYAEEVTNIVLTGPLVTINYDRRTSNLRAEIRDVANESEMIYARETARRIVLASGFKPASIRDITEAGESESSYITLVTLFRTDPELFGTRVLQTGEKVNYSRKCQTADRHPVPVSAEEASRLPSDRIVKLRNTTYGGMQTYYCPSSSFPFPAFRQVASDELCMPCCNSTKVTPDSLKAREYQACARVLMYDLDDIKEFTNIAMPYAGPIQFVGQDIPEGRLCKLPDGVREFMPSDTYMFYPPGVNRKSFPSIMSWITGEIIELDTTDLSQQLMQLSANGYYVAVVELRPSSGKRWFPSIIMPTSSSYVITSESHIIFKLQDSFYPLRTQNMEPVYVPKNIIKSYFNYRQRTEGLGMQLFVLDSLTKAIDSKRYVIEGYMRNAHKTYGVIARDLKHSGHDASSMYIPVMSSDVHPPESINEYQMSDLPKFLPSIEQLTDFFLHMREQPILAIARDIRDGKHTYAFQLQGEVVTFYTKPFTKYPKVYTHTDEESFEMSQKLLHFLLNTPEPATPIVPPSIQREKIINVTSMYIASVVARKYKSVSPDTFASMAKKFVSILRKDSEDKIELPITDTGMLLFSKKLKVTSEVFDIAVGRLIANAPSKTPSLFRIYLSSRGNMIDHDEFDVKTGEKLLKFSV